MQTIETNTEHDKTTKTKERFSITDEAGNSLGSIYLPKGAKACKVTIEWE